MLCPLSINPMPTHVVPNGTKLHIPTLFEGGHSVKDICSILGVKKTLVYMTLCHYKSFGTICNPHSYSCTIWHHCILSLVDSLIIHNVIQHCSTIYLNKLQKMLWETRHVHATLSTISHTLQCLWLTQKVVSFSAAEWSNELCALYMNHIGAKAPDTTILLFIDEAAKDWRTSSHRCGRSPRGLCCHGLHYFVCGIKYSILPAIMLDGVIVYNIIEGPVNKVLWSGNHPPVIVLLICNPLFLWWRGYPTMLHIQRSWCIAPFALHFWPIPPNDASFLQMNDVTLGNSNFNQYFLIYVCKDILSNPLNIECMLISRHMLYTKMCFSISKEMCEMR